LNPSACTTSSGSRLLVALPILAVTAAWFCLALAPSDLQAQDFDATTLRQPTDLAATWLIRAGDDPSYANSGLDDSGWTRFDSNSSLKTVFPNSRPDIVWYRLHVKVLPSQTALALAESNIDSAFEVYVNGQRIMRCGQVAPFVPWTDSAALLARITDNQMTMGHLVIALRVHIAKSEWNDSYQGFNAPKLTLGQYEVLHQLHWLSILGANFSAWTYDVVVFVVALLALTLFAAQRSHHEYLWTFLLGMSAVIMHVYSIFSSFYNLPVFWLLPRYLIEIAGCFLLVSLYFGFVNQRIGRWVWVYIAVPSLLFMLEGFSTLGVAPSSLAMLPVVHSFPIIFNFMYESIIMFIIPAMLLFRLRRGDREAGILLIPLFLSAISSYAYWGAYLLTLFGLSSQVGPAAILSRIYAYHVGPVALPPGAVGATLCWISLAVIMVLRFNRTSRQQASLEGEVAAAREVQQVIVPEQIEDIAGFCIEAVYLPAQQVGGDFFQILPDEKGGLLAVIGDVAGKGLPAAMLVSVLVGAIRTVAEDTLDPAQMLSKLNKRLLGRSNGGFSTALCAHLSVSGLVTIANAGHLSPYLNGREVELAGALPLGILNRPTYETSQFFLAPGSRLTFYSDGVVEAQNQQGELFGFERGKEISTQPAAVIVEAAKQFGQVDDITVVTIERLEAAEESTKMGAAPILAPA